MNNWREVMNEKMRSTKPSVFIFISAFKLFYCFLSLIGKILNILPELILVDQVILNISPNQFFFYLF